MFIASYVLPNYRVRGYLSYKDLEVYGEKPIETAGKHLLAVVSRRSEIFNSYDFTIAILCGNKKIGNKVIDFYRYYDSGNGHRNIFRLSTWDGLEDKFKVSDMTEDAIILLGEEAKLRRTTTNNHEFILSSPQLSPEIFSRFGVKLTLE